MKKEDKQSDLNETMRFDREAFQRELEEANVTEELETTPSEDMTESEAPEEYSPATSDDKKHEPSKSQMFLNRIKITTLDWFGRIGDVFTSDEDDETFDLSYFDPENEALRQEDIQTQREQTEELEEAIETMPETVVHDESLDQEAVIEDVPEDLVEGSYDEHYISGTAWLTAGSMFSRILGALYVIPWATWFGQEYTQANNLFSIGYKPYALLLAIATAGFPSAIAKQMAYYNSKREYDVAQRLFKYSFYIMIGTGILTGLALFLMAPGLAAQTPAMNIADATLVIRSLVPALVILPAMSLIRGYFQGFHDMKPTAISQVIEQIVRVIYMLTATYAIMKVYQGEVTQAVVHSTFAAFVGAVASSIYLVIVYLRQLPKVKALSAHSVNQIQLDFVTSIKLILKDSIPFILIGSGIIIAQLVDLFTFRQILELSTSLLHTEIRELYGTISLDVDKLMMIVISIAVAMATAAIPTVASSYGEGEIKETSELIEDITILFFVIMLPAAFGMAAIADNLYPLFYVNGSQAGPSLLVTGAYSSIALGAYTIFSAILQSLDHRRAAIKYLLIGLGVKLLLQYPFVAVFAGHGALVSTMIAFTVSSVLMWLEISRHTEIDYPYLIKTIIQVFIPAIIMGLVVALWNRTFNLVFGDVGRAMTFVKILLNVSIGVFVYGLGLGVQGKLSLIIGDRYPEFQEKIRLI